MGRPTGHVARLPFALRQSVNFMLRDGEPYAAIARYCAAQNHAEVTEKNVENWANGDGHGHWLAEQLRIDDIQARRDLALRVAEGGGVDITGAAMQIAASDLMEVLQTFDIQKLKDSLSNDPEIYTGIVDSLTKLGKGSVEFAKYKAAVEERKAAIARELEAAKGHGGITADTLTRIERELKLL